MWLDAYLSPNILRYFNLLSQIVYEMTTPSIQNLLEYNVTRSDVSRYLRRPYPKYSSKTLITDSSLVHKGSLLYNMLPVQFYTMSLKKFKKEIITYIRIKLPPDKIITRKDIS